MLKVEYIPIDDIEPYAGNAKLHPAEQIEQIKSSIQEFGFNDPIAIWKNNECIEGHGRIIAARELGFTEVPVIRLDDLTDEQRRAYILVHNKLTMNSGFDPELLALELEDIQSLDIGQYGFELPDVDESDFEQLHEKYKSNTDFRKENVENLGIARFDGVGKYDIPYIKPVKDLPEIKEWVGFNYVLSDPDPSGKAVHFFLDDYQFERIWNDPDKYVDKLKQYVCVASPDFSPWGAMPNALQIYNHYRKHWVAAYLQMYGVTIIPTIRGSSDNRSMEWFLEGEPEDGIIIVSSMWSDREEMKEIDRIAFKTIVERLHPRKIFVYGKKTEAMSECNGIDVEYIDNFTQKRYNLGGITDAFQT